MSEWSQSFTLTKNVGQGFFLCSTPPTQWLSSSPSRWRCLLRVLCPVRKPVAALDWVLLKDRNPALAPRQGPEISSRACLWVSPRPRHRTQCWLTTQRLIFLHISCLETSRAGSGQRNPGTHSSMSSDPVQPHRMPFGTVGPMETLFWWPEELSKPPDYQSRYSHISLVYSEIELHKYMPRQHISQPERL